MLTNPPKDIQGFGKDFGDDTCFLISIMCVMPNMDFNVKQSNIYIPSCSVQLKLFVQMFQASKQPQKTTKKINLGQVYTMW